MVCAGQDQITIRFLVLMIGFGGFVSLFWFVGVVLLLDCLWLKWLALLVWLLLGGMKHSFLPQDCMVCSLHLCLRSESLERKVLGRSTAPVVVISSWVRQRISVLCTASNHLEGVGGCGPVIRESYLNG